MTKILITNDDGYTADGLYFLASELEKIGDITIIAPSHNWSASGHTKTLHRPIKVEEKYINGKRIYVADGAPSDCVALAMLGLLEEEYDIVVSGINSNANLGHDVTYSGTVTAAMEAVVWGVCGLAVSIQKAEENKNYYYDTAAKLAAMITIKVLENKLPEKTLLNINVPNLPVEKIKGIKITRQGKRVYRDRLVIDEDAEGNTIYWIGGEPPDGIPEKGTDIGALSDGYVSITPLSLDMTDYALIEKMMRWEWDK